MGSGSDNSSAAFRSRLRHRAVQAVALVLGTLLALLAMEVVLRMNYGAEELKPPYLQHRLARFEPHPFLPYTGRTSDQRVLSHRHDYLGEFTMAYSNNSYGFLGEEFRREKGPSEWRIVTLGGSTTWEAGIDPATRKGDATTTWPAVLQRTLADRYPTRSVTVYNLAQNAFSSPMSVINLAFVGVSLQPDVVVCYDGINDMAQTFDFDFRTDYAGLFKDYERYRSVGLKFPAWLFQSRLVCWTVTRVDGLLGWGRATDAFATVNAFSRAEPHAGSWWNSATLKNIDLFQRNLKTMRGICQEHGAVFIAATPHYYRRDALRREFCEQMRAFFQEEAMHFFDADRFIPKEDPALNTDEVHFTKAGNELMADGFAQVVTPLLDAKLRE
jgi:lysophospholipase L1-like esterase